MGISGATGLAPASISFFSGAAFVTRGPSVAVVNYDLVFLRLIERILTTVGIQHIQSGGADDA